jgi:hypothetical protein
MKKSRFSEEKILAILKEAVTHGKPRASITAWRRARCCTLHTPIRVTDPTAQRLPVITAMATKVSLRL